MSLSVDKKCTGPENTQQQYCTDYKADCVAISRKNKERIDTAQIQTADSATLQTQATKNITKIYINKQISKK